MKYVCKPLKSTIQIPSLALTAVAVARTSSQELLLQLRGGGATRVKYGPPQLTVKGGRRARELTVKARPVPRAKMPSDVNFGNYCTADFVTVTTCISYIPNLTIPVKQ